VQIAVFPELCITGYTCADLFFQTSLQEAAYGSLIKIVEESRAYSMLVVVSLPIGVNGKLYNCAAFVCEGRLLGVVPKTHLPNYAEYYEKRWFDSAPKETINIYIPGFDYSVPFGTKLLFRCTSLSELVVAGEICEDLWAFNPASTNHALAGATVIVNPSAGDETVGKHDYRKNLVSGQSARILGAYIYASAGHGESTTDMIFSGNNLICENGTVLSEILPFADGRCCAFIDVKRLVSERQKNMTFVPETNEYSYVDFDLEYVEQKLDRFYDKHPFVPSDARLRAERCELILNIQADGLAKRLEHTNAKTAVIGISGGLDSCLALLVAVRAMKKIGRSEKDVYAVTMPCFGTTKHTRSNAEILCNELGVTFEEINITKTVRSHFEDLHHSEDNYDVTYENVQARIRTLVLMNKSNQLMGLVVGTGDLSELALGWATYNGDHMSMYAVNAGVPKTLVRHIVEYEADLSKDNGKEKLYDVLESILDTPVSPELLPVDSEGEMSQKTESIVGPYELHDFYLYYVLRFGFAPSKIYRIACIAFEGEYSEKELAYWLDNFYRRFFAQQFKRSCLPDGPKVGSVTLSPRGDWRMPSDASANAWRKEIEEIIKKYN